MLGTILNLFGRSPFAPLQSHMEKVSMCVNMLVDLFEALEAKDYRALEHLSGKISDYEHQADLTKNDIRNRLPKSLFLPIDRGHLLEILNIQDRIADEAENAAVLVMLKPIEIPSAFKMEFKEFLQKNIATFHQAQLIIKEMHELLESSFGGIEAEKVCAMVDQVGIKEHEADLVQRQLLKKVFCVETEMAYTTFHLWQKIFVALSSIANLSETLALRVRMTLELK